MTPQQIFNKVVKHLRKQGKRAGIGEGDDFACQYRGPDKTSCAVGCLLKDSEYRPQMEGTTVEALTTLPARLSSYIPLLSELQTLHDEDINWKQRGGIRESAIRSVAKAFNLKVPSK